jgi:hypothetical protein
LGDLTVVGDGRESSDITTTSIRSIIIQTPRTPPPLRPLIGKNNDFNLTLDKQELFFQRNNVEFIPDRCPQHHENQGQVVYFNN